MIEVIVKAIDTKTGHCFATRHSFSIMKKAIIYSQTFRESCENSPEVNIKIKLYEKNEPK